jgi:hypothetical protein
VHGIGQLSSSRHFSGLAGGREGWLGAIAEMRAVGGVGRRDSRRATLKCGHLLPQCRKNAMNPETDGSRPKWRTRLVEGGFPDRTFDIEFWQEQGDEAIFRAAWEMVETAEEIKHGRKPTLQRTVTHLE